MQQRRRIERPNFLLLAFGILTAVGLLAYYIVTMYQAELTK